MITKTTTPYISKRKQNCFDTSSAWKLRDIWQIIVDVILFFRYFRQRKFKLADKIIILELGKQSHLPNMMAILYPDWTNAIQIIPIHLILVEYYEIEHVFESNKENVLLIF